MAQVDTGSYSPQQAARCKPCIGERRFAAGAHLYMVGTSPPSIADRSVVGREQGSRLASVWCRQAADARWLAVAWATSTTSTSINTDGRHRPVINIYNYYYYHYVRRHRGREGRGDGAQPGPGGWQAGGRGWCSPCGTRGARCGCSIRHHGAHLGARCPRNNRYVCRVACAVGACAKLQLPAGSVPG